MKRLIFALFFFPSGAFSQQLPMKDGKVIFEQIDSVPGAPKLELYKRSKIWIANTFHRSKAVIQIEDTAAGQIIGKANFDYLYMVLLEGATWTCNFTLQIDCRDNKARIKIYDISSHCAVEETAEYWNQHRQGKHIRAINENCFGMLATFKSSLNKGSDNF